MHRHEHHDPSISEVIRLPAYTRHGWFTSAATSVVLAALLRSALAQYPDPQISGFDHHHMTRKKMVSLDDQGNAPAPMLRAAY